MRSLKSLLKQVLPLDADKPPTVLDECLFPPSFLKNDLICRIEVEVFGTTVKLQSQFFLFPGEIHSMATQTGLHLELWLWGPDAEPLHQLTGQRLAGRLGAGVCVVQSLVQRADTPLP